MKRLISILLVLLMTVFCAAAEQTGPVLTDCGTEMSCGSIHYPAVTGMADETLQARINDALQTTGRVADVADRWVSLLSTSLRADLAWRADETAFAGGIVSCVFMAEGALTDTRPEQRNTACVLDLRTGEPVNFDDLFTDSEAAREAISEYIGYTVVPELNAYLTLEDLTELPQDFSVDVQGITFWYTQQDYTMLSDRAGSIRVPWSALTEWLRLGEDTVLRRIGAETMLLGGDGAADAIAACVTAGALPGIPAVMGESMQSLTDTYCLLNDPDLMDGGRLFALEDCRFRGVWIVTDSLTETWDDSIVQGIRTNEYSLYGLVTGKSTREDCLALLGEPFITLEMDEELADSQCLVPGTSDYFVFGEYRLRLHFDGDGILCTVWIG